MEVEIPLQLRRNITKASKELGLSNEEIVSKAVLMYLKNLKEFKSLYKEMREWEALSDEALINFEKSL